MKKNLKETLEYGHNLKVLFVEDNESVRIQLLKLLENFFSNIETEIDGLSAYKNYLNYYEEKQTFYDLVITDLSMPKMNGIELSKKIIGYNPNQLILVISAHTDSDKLLELIDIGIYKFLQKPVDYKELLNNLISIISKIKREKEYLALENRVKTVKSDNKKLKELVITDNLTSLYNRRFIDDMLIQKLDHSKKVEVSDYLSIIFIDIDNFKTVNDTYGHLVGDTVLIEFAHILKSNMRNNDIVGKWGGEEFIILLERTSHSQSIIIAENLRKIIEENKFTKIENLTASFGIASCKNNDTISSLIQKADFSLYKAKENGKNMIYSSDDINNK